VPRRYDTGVLERAEPTPQGGIRVPAFLTRVGVFRYVLPDGTIRRELRLPEDVFRPESLASFHGAPVTYLHPEVDGVRIEITADNWREYARGHVAEDVKPSLGPYRTPTPTEPDHIGASLLIQDRELIGLVASGGAKEVSCGYTCRLEPKSGVWNGEPFDVIQRDMLVNHAALGPVGWGRAGSTVALRLDSDDGIQLPEPESEIVMKEMIDGVEYTVGSPEHLAALRKSRDTAQGRADASEKRVAEIPQDQLNEAVKRRAKLVVYGERIATSKGKHFDADAALGATDPDLMGRLILELDPSFKVEGKSADYLSGVLETLIKTLKSGGKAPTPAAAPAESTDAATDIQKPVDPEKKTDAKRDIFSAREGQEAPKVPAGNGAEDRYDSDKARSTMVQGHAERSKRPLAISAERK
jgi:hypothetical protein